MSHPTERKYTPKETPEQRLERKWKQLQTAMNQPRRNLHDLTHLSQDFSATIRGLYEKAKK